MQIVAFITGALGLCSAAIASNLEARQLTPTPSLTHLYSLNCTLDPKINVGDGPYGNRAAIPIIGGTFEGPRIKGTIRNLGADWGLTDNRGVFHPDTRYGLTTDDGAEIYIRTFGSKQSTGGIYLHGLYETGSDKYWWLNDIVAVGILESGTGWVYIDMYYMTDDGVNLVTP
ncbi:hypothetical protein MCOR25_009402 [Pyricularia grisea]|uniref:Uncharacterized protein n=1 Tax=Pyricularia grisea TaxID=148305 RepID=A0A6P8B402_PYRGI|nr:hypothetical protein PgNI_05454 [Pyricularia grisea]KAI6352489.1 hypothetical protein MCOR25_009402 [Pyricularia grisea]TLD10003.1 hypothetical protein PgNI_05454 [Pyricularia grisea]